MAIGSPLQPSKGNTANITPFLTPTRDANSREHFPVLQKGVHLPQQDQDQDQGQQTRQEHEDPETSAISHITCNDLEDPGIENKTNLKQLGEKEIKVPTPPYLLNLTEKDAETLRIPDDQFKLDTWETVKRRVRENKLDEFKRVPSQLRQYLEYVWGLKQSPVYGGVQNFILRERLGWDLREHSPPALTNRENGNPPLRVRNGVVVDGDVSLTVNGDGDGRKKKTEDLFANPQDIKILQNDWPYGIDERIVHLVVWTKFPLEDDPITGDLKPDVRRQIDGYVKRKFTNSSSSPNPYRNPKAPGEDSVIWFKNWTSIKSIYAVEHFHVMLFDPDPDFVDQVTGGDIPLWKKKQEMRKERH